MSSQPSFDELNSILNTMKRNHIVHGPASAERRKDRLQRAVNLIKDNRDQLAQAMSQDFGHRSKYQSLVADIATTIKGLQHAIASLDNWMQPEPVFGLEGELQAHIQKQPLGVVGVISPWNFPINLAFGPLAGIFAAGNTAMLKPSELTPHTSQLLAELIGRYFDPMELAVVLGDANVGQDFSRLAFDHLVFTGSTAVGKHVMRAAAENLVPVTLELGGKSPVVVGDNANIQMAAERTLTIKTFNVGQICLSPDYMLIPDAKRDDFVDAARAFMRKSFATMQDNADYTSIINSRHFERLQGLLDDAAQRGATIISLAPEGEPSIDEATRKIAPHLVLDVNDDMAIMQEEIFGPLLPIQTYRQEAQAIEYINAHPRPLAAYYFSNDEQKQRAFAAHTTSGALVINDIMTHASIDALPFGGVGPSGMGAYHGVHGFNNFTHHKAVVIQTESNESGQRLRAPYSEKQALVESMLAQ